jgi:hypothetical protein
MSNEAIAAPVDGGEEESGAPAAEAFEADGLRGWAEALVDRARSEGVALTGEGRVADLNGSGSPSDRFGCGDGRPSRL